MSVVFYKNLHLILAWDLYNHFLKTTVTIIKLWSHCVHSRLPFFAIADFVSWIASIIIIMKGSSYSLRVMKSARNKSTHHLQSDQHQLGAASIATKTLQTIPSRGPTPAQTPDEVSSYPTFCLNHWINIQLSGKSQIIYQIVELLYCYCILSLKMYSKSVCHELHDDERFMIVSTSDTL